MYCRICRINNYLSIFIESCSFLIVICSYSCNKFFDFCCQFAELIYFLKYKVY